MYRKENSYIRIVRINLHVVCQFSLDFKEKCIVADCFENNEMIGSKYKVENMPEFENDTGSLVAAITRLYSDIYFAGQVAKLIYADILTHRKGRNGNEVY